jgi:hypothetical protein
MKVMRPRKLLLGAVLGVLAVFFAVPTTGSAAGNGCPTSGNPGSNPGVRDAELMTVDAAVQRTIAQITDEWYAFVGTTKAEVVAERTAGITAQDKNEDGLVCVVEAWGSELNPKSHWALFWGDLLDPAETQRFGIFDNHMGTSNNS